jgi:hypothetical protein
MKFRIGPAPAASRTDRTLAHAPIVARDNPISRETQPRRALRPMRPRPAAPTEYGFGRHPPRPPGPLDAAINDRANQNAAQYLHGVWHRLRRRVGRHPRRYAEPDGFSDTEQELADVSRMVDRMDVSHYRPGCLSAAEEVAVDGHHHLRVKSWDRPPGAGAVQPPAEASPLMARPAHAPRRPMRGPRRPRPACLSS